MAAADTAVSAAMIKSNGVMKIEDIIHNEPPRLLVVYDQGQEHITKLVAEVLGHSYSIAGPDGIAKGWDDDVVICGADSRQWSRGSSVSAEVSTAKHLLRSSR